MRTVPRPNADKWGWTAYKAKHPERARYYASADWRRRRTAQLKAEPTCRICGAPATDVDHVVAIALGGPLGGPLRSLCRKHHHEKTVRDSHEAAKRAVAKRKIPE